MRDHGLGPIPVARARQLLGESIVDIVLTRGTEIAAIAPAGRGWTAHQRLALQWAHNGCAVAGCTCPRVQIDHRDPYAQGGPTITANADPLCAWHHQLKTHHGHALIGPPGAKHMVPPDHPDHPDNQ